MPQQIPGIRPHQSMHICKAQGCAREQCCTGSGFIPLSSDHALRKTICWQCSDNTASSHATPTLSSAKGLVHYCMPTCMFTHTRTCAGGVPSDRQAAAQLAENAQTPLSGWSRGRCLFCARRSLPQISLHPCNMALPVSVWHCHHRPFGCHQGTRSSMSSAQSGFQVLVEVRLVACVSVVACKE